MGTKSTTKIKDAQGNIILSLYCQFDGYPDGVGKQLRNLCAGKTILNGFSTADREAYGEVFNGMECFALWLVTQLKTGIGHWYATTDTDKQEYNYEIVPVGNGCAVRLTSE